MLGSQTNVKKKSSSLQKNVRNCPETILNIAENYRPKKFTLEINQRYLPQNHSRNQQKQFNQKSSQKLPKPSFKKL